MNYATFTWGIGFSKALFTQAKVEGIVDTSFDTVRTSLDGTAAVLKWLSGPVPPSIQSLLITQFDRASAEVALDTAAWETAVPAVLPPPPKGNLLKV